MTDHDCAKMIQRAVRPWLFRRRKHWSEVSRGHCNWRKAVEEGKDLHRRRLRGYTRYVLGHPEYIQNVLDVYNGDEESNRMFFAAVYNGDEESVRTLLANGAKIDCVDVSAKEEGPWGGLSLTKSSTDGYDSDGYDSDGFDFMSTRYFMPLDMALHVGHGAIACMILDTVGSGRAEPGKHPECVPSARTPWELLQLCNAGAKKLMSRWGCHVPRRYVERRAMAEAVHRLLQSSHVDENPYWESGWHQDLNPKLVDLRVPGVLRTTFTANSLLMLACWAWHDDLAARLYLAGARFTRTSNSERGYGIGHYGTYGSYRNYKSRRGEYTVREYTCVASTRGEYKTPPRVREFVARAVVRTLLRRAVKTHLIVWWWKEAAGKSKYAKPDVAGFEHDMDAPIFSEGALGA